MSSNKSRLVVKEYLNLEKKIKESKNGSFTIREISKEVKKLYEEAGWKFKIQYGDPREDNSESYT